MKERPILFSDTMVQAIMAGTKTQTRRALKKQPLDVMPHTIPHQWLSLMERNPNHGGVFACRYGVPGDRLWVREAAKLRARGDGWFDLVYRADEPMDGEIRQFSFASYAPYRFTGWTPSVNMPRWASRLTLEIVAVRCERLQEITPDDIMAEGIEFMGDQPSPRDEFSGLWERINPKRNRWGDNPYVWVLEFKRIADDQKR